MSAAEGDDDASYAFKHALVRDAAYELMLFSQRQRLHRAVAEWYEAHAGEELPSKAALLAHHYGLAEASREALRWSRRAGDRAMALFANAEALEHHRSAESWCERLLLDAAEGEAEGLRRTRFDILQAKAAVLGRLGRHDEAECALRDSIDVTRELRDGKIEVHALSRLAGHLVDTGRLEGALELGRTAEAIARGIPDAMAIAKSCNVQSFVHFRMGRLDEALSLGTTALERASEAGRQSALPPFLNNLGNIGIITGHYEEGLARYHESLRIAKEEGDLLAELVYTGNVAFALWHIGDFEGALARAREALAIARDVGDRDEETRARVNAGRALTHLGRLDEAEAELREALGRAREEDQPYLRANALNYLAMVLLARGDPAAIREAADLARSAAEIGQARGFAHAEVFGRSLEARALLALGDEAGAVTTSGLAVRLLESLGRVEGAEEEVYLHHSRCHRARGRHEEADRYLARAREELSTKASRIRDARLRELYLAVDVNRAIAGPQGSTGAMGR